MNDLSIDTQMSVEPKDEAADDVLDDASADEGDLQLEGVTKFITVAPDKNDRSLSEFHRWYKRKRLVVDPEWQREYVWDRKRASRLIESF